MAPAQKTQTDAIVAEDEVVNVVVDDGARLGVRRYLTIPGRDPFDEVEWEVRNAFIPGKDKPVFEQKGVEFRSSGRRPRPTSSPRSTSAAR